MWTSLHNKKDSPTTIPPLERLAALNRSAEAGGGKEKLAKQHSAGKMTARERIHFFLDEGSFEELDKFVTNRCLDFGMLDQQIPGDGVVT